MGHCEMILIGEKVQYGHCGRMILIGEKVQYGHCGRMILIGEKVQSVPRSKQTPSRL
jgi:hypothetical protein